MERTIWWQNEDASMVNTARSAPPVRRRTHRAARTSLTSVLSPARRQKAAKSCSPSRWAAAESMAATSSGWATCHDDPGQERVRCLGIEHQVLVGAAHGREAGVETVRRLGQSLDGDLRAETPVERPGHRGGVDRVGDGEAHHLGGGVDAAVGAPGDERLHRAGEGLQGRLQLALDRPHRLLPGIAVEPGAVVGEVDAIGGHRRSGPVTPGRSPGSRRPRSTRPARAPTPPATSPG